MIEGCPLATFVRLWWRLSQTRVRKIFLNFALISGILLNCGGFLGFCQSSANALPSSDIRQYHFFTERRDSVLLRLKTRLEAERKADSTNFRIALELCKVFIATGDYYGALECGTSAVTLTPNDAESHLWLARAYGMCAEHSSFLKAFFLVKKARREFQQAVRLKPDYLAARFDLFQYYIFAPRIVGGSIAKARDQMEAIARTLSSYLPEASLISNSSSPSRTTQPINDSISAAQLLTSRDLAFRWLTQAIMYQENQNLDSAEFYYRKAIKADTAQRGVLLLTIAFMYLTQRQFARGLEVLTEYDAQSPPQADYIDLLQPGFYRNGFLEKTRRIFDDRKKEWQMPIQIYQILSRMYQREGNLSKAKEYNSLFQLHHGER